MKSTREHTGVLLAASGATISFAVWIGGGSYRWCGYPAEVPFGTFIAATLSLLAVSTIYGIYRTLIADGQKSPREVYLCVAAWSISRLTLTSIFPLGGDEAYHWQWACRLDLCYYDHPAMIAWLTRLFAPLTGQANALVRLSPLLLSSGTAVLTYHLGRIMLRDERIATTATLLFMLVPIFTGSALLVPMVAVTFFSVLTMTMLYRAIENNRRIDWTLAGLALGAALNSNFTPVLLVGLAGIFFLWSKRCRRLLWSRGPYWSFLVALLCCAPMIWWNWKHDWVTFGFNLLKRHHELEFRKEAPVSYLLILCLLLGPPLAIRLVHFGAAQLRKARQLKQDNVLFLICMGFGPIIVFLITACFLKPRPHYAAPGFIPLLLLFAKELAERAEPNGPSPRHFACPENRGKGREGEAPAEPFPPDIASPTVTASWLRTPARGAALLSMIIPLTLLVPAVIPPETAHSLLTRYQPSRADKAVAEIYGWPALARYLDGLGVDFRRDSSTVLIAPSYAQASLVMTASHSVDYAYSLDEGKIPYGQQFAIWGSLSDLPLGVDALIVSAGALEARDADLARWQQFFESVEAVSAIGAEPRLQYFSIFKARCLREHL